MSPEEFKIQVLPMKNKLYRLSLRMLGSTEEAEDAVQETFIRLWTKREDLSNYSSIEAFAMTVTKNLSLDRIRSKSFRTETMTERDLMVMKDDPEDSLEKEDYRGFVGRIIDSLPEQQKLIMQLRDIEGEDYEQIAEIVGLNVNAVRVNLSRARKKVRDTIIKIQGYELAGN